MPSFATLALRTLTQTCQPPSSGVANLAFCCTRMVVARWDCVCGRQEPTSILLNWLAGR